MDLTPGDIAVLTPTFADEFDSWDVLDDNTPSGIWDTAIDPNSAGSSGFDGSHMSQWYLNAQYNYGQTYTAPWQLDSNSQYMRLIASPNPNIEPGYTYQSALLIDHGQHVTGGYGYGFYEFSARLPDTPGWWPALWLYTETGGGSDQEVDVVEGYTSASTGNRAYSTVHSDYLPGGMQGAQLSSYPAWSSGFHTYAVDLEPDFITFYYDNGQTMRIATPAGFENTTWKVLMNLAVGPDGYAGDPNNQTAEMDVDYFHYYASSNTFAAPTGSTYTAGTNVVRIDLDTAGGQTLTPNSAGDLFALFLQTTTDFSNFQADTIQNFHAGSDSIDIGPTLGHIYLPPNYSTTYDYFANDPSNDGHILFTNDGLGDAIVTLDPHPGTPGDTTIELFILPGISASQLSISNGVITAVATSSAVSTSASSYTAPAGVTDITLTGSSSQTITGNNAGDTFHSSDNGNTLIGGTGADTFDMGRGGDWATGNGGADTFAYAGVPWSGGGITDFNSADRIDLTGLLQTVTTVNSSYHTGDDPFTAGILRYVTDGSGNVVLQANYEVSGNNGWWTVATLDNITNSASLSYSSGVITEGGGGGATVNVSDASYTAPANVTVINLTGTGSQSIDASATSGVTINSTNNGNALTGGAGADVFHLGRAGDWVTGNGGGDTFAYAEVPWAAGEITDFNGGQGDKIDLTGLLQTVASANSSYHTGDNPFTNGILQYTTDSSGYVVLQANYEISGNNSWWTVATLDHITSTSGLSYSNGMIT